MSTFKLFQAPSLRTLIVVITLLVLALPIAGIVTLRVFESILHRQTEAKLISEGAYIRSLYLLALSPGFAGSEGLFRKITPDADPEAKWRPYFPVIDMSRNKVLPPAPPGKIADRPPHPAVMEAGEIVQPILQQAQTQNLSAVRVLDVNGVVIASTGAELGLDLSGREEVAIALAGRYASVLRERITDSPRPSWDSISRASKIRVFVAVPISEGDRLYGVAYLSRTSLSPARNLMEPRIYAAFALMIGITVLIGLVLAHLATHPLKVMVSQAQRVARGEKGVRLELSGFAPREARELSEALAAMVDRLRRRLEYVEEFTRNVSHEFKTPLSSLQGAIEILEEGWESMSGQERSRFLSMIASDVRRMDRLTRRLLELARLEMAEPSREEVDLAKLVDHLASRWRESGRELEVIKKTDSTVVRIGADAAETMLGNLIDNAFTHGAPPVRVTVENGSVTVSDSGPGISLANLPRVFDRFFTTARAKGGTGLGLAMVKAVAEKNGVTVSVHSEGQGADFRLDFESNKP